MVGKILATRRCQKSRLRSPGLADQTSTKPLRMKKNCTPDRPRLKSRSVTCRRSGSVMIPIVPAWKAKTSRAATQRRPVRDGSRRSCASGGVAVTLTTAGHLGVHRSGRHWIAGWEGKGQPSSRTSLPHDG